MLPRIFFEPTILCNLSCFQAVCSQESGIIQTRARTQFPFPQFQELIREIGKDLVRLDFFNYGESFVHPQAVDMIEYIKNTFPHIYLYTSTNGLMLDEDKIRRLVGAGLDEITFSVDGPDPETYIRYRRRGSLPALLSLMERFVQERDAVGREVPYINWRYILFKWNDSRRKMNKARKLAAKIGVDRLTWEITDHPPEAVSLRYQIGSPHWRRIYHEIWDSSQIGNALPGRRFTAKIRPRTAAFRTEIGRTAALDVTVKNTGGAAWRRSSYSGRRLVRLGAQLFDGNRCLLDLNFARTWLRHDMEKGETTALTLEFPAVEHTGEYWLKLDMVAEGVDWFESGGSPVAWVRWDIFEPPPPP